MVSVINAKSNKWCINEKTFYKGKKIDHLPFQFGLHQLINEPKHIIDKVTCCIDLIFTSQPKSLMDTGLHSLLHLNCHPKIAYTNFKLQTCYPTPYKCEI